MQFIRLEMRWFVKGADWRIAGLSGHNSLQDQCRQAQAESIQLTNWMCDILDALEAGNANDVINSVIIKALELCKRFPVYAE